MAGRKRLILLGAATFLLGALLMFPARVAVSWFVPDTVNLSGVTGTVWTGRAAQGAANGMYFTDLSWSFKPLSLLKARLAFDAAIRTSAGRIESYAAIGVTGAVTLKDLNGSLVLSAVHPAIQANGVDGTLMVQMEHLVFSDGLPSEATGVLSLGNLTTQAFGQDALGNFRANVTTDDNGIVALVEDAGAVIGIEGTVSLKNDRSYLFTGYVSPKPDTPAVIEQNLRFLGSADSDGRRQFRFEGSL